MKGWRGGGGVNKELNLKKGWKDEEAGVNEELKLNKGWKDEEGGV